MKNWHLKKLVLNIKGTALLVALLVMGVLIAISLALSTLILRETRITIDFINAGQAYYSAESGVELALYSLNSKLPGWQPENDPDGYSSYAIDEKDDGIRTLGEVKVKNRCKAYPCLDEEEFNFKGAGLKEFYGVLDLNESITVPLFVADGISENGIKEITDFTVEYYAPFSVLGGDLKFKEIGNLTGWDVLRWKLFGITDPDKFSGIKATESISDFTAVSTFNSGTVETDAKNPSWFGTISCSKASQGARYSTEIKCNPPPNVVCDNRTAREFYVYTYSFDENGEVQKKVEEGDIKECYSIKTFLDNHDLNYLTLTNLINPDVLEDSKNEALQKLYLRIELFNDEDFGETVREFADITANGYSGDSKQSINVKIKKDSYMPVFNFSLYSTYMSNKKEKDGKVHDEEYWYGKEDN